MSRANHRVAPQQQEHKKAVSQQNDFNRSEISILSQSNKKNHLSESVKKSIAYAVQQHHQQQQAIRKLEHEESQLTKLVRSKIKQLRRISVCEICSSDFKRSELYLCDCPHKQSFCSSCLYAYAIYKIKQFEEVYCPAQDCPVVIDTNTSFFQKMPISTQNNYYKIHRFTIASKDSSVVKLCPNQKCEGYLRLKQDEGLICDACFTQYCAKCYLAKHEGSCDQFQLNYFQNNLYYRQCRRCKMIVQRNKGCNHMTCRCLYQFCYICGEKWSHNHAKMHQEHPQNPLPQARIHTHSFLLIVVQSFICQDCHQGGCLSFWNSYIGIIIKLIAKMVLLLIECILLLLQLVFKDLPFLFWMLVLTILIGLFITSFQIICESDCVKGVFLMLLFPVAILLGVFRSCSQVLLPAMHQFCNGSIVPISDDINDIINF